MAVEAVLARPEAAPAEKKGSLSRSSLSGGGELVRLVRRELETVEPSLSPSLKLARAAAMASASSVGYNDVSRMVSASMSRGAS